MSYSKEITLIGAGLAGPVLAIYLAKRGFRVEIFERRPDMRKEHISAGRSINLALSARGIHALSEVGLAEKILQLAIPMRGRMMHSIKGELSFHPYGKNENEVINAISRAELNKALLDEAERRGGEIHFNQRCTGMNFESGELHLRDEIIGADTRLAVKTVIGTDGSASALRHDMMKIARFNLSQHYLEHGYKELTIPPGPNGEFRLEKHALHIWPRRSFMLIALPNLDGSFTCTLFFPHRGELSFESLSSEEKVLEFFKTQFPDAVPLMPTLLEDFFANPTGSLVTIKCDPWSVENKALLLGDAAHAIVPFFGQGMNCAFEDCTVLNECLEKFDDDWEKIFREFETLRKVNTDAIADMALENFIEMRDKVADPKFLFRKQVELALEERFPGRFIPRYSMVSFHRIPYSAAQSRGRIQDEILTKLTDGVEELAEIDWKEAGWLVKEFLEPLQGWPSPETEKERTAKVKFSFSDIEDAFLFVSSDQPEMNTAVLSEATGRIYYFSEMDGSDEEPEEVGDPGPYIHIPHKNDLDLGRELVFDFVSERLPENYDQVLNIFRHKGAYSRFKSLLDSKGLLDEWYQFEDSRTKAALREWCEENGIDLAEH
jgi:kynurenine 3-monooxygenase